MICTLGSDDFFFGTVVKYKEASKTYHIAFADGDVDENVDAEHMRDPTQDEIDAHEFDE